MARANDLLQALPLLARGWVRAVLGALCVALWTTQLEVTWAAAQSAANARSVNPELASHGRTLVSYAYFEKDGIQRANLEFFAAVGMVRPPGHAPGEACCLSALFCLRTCFKRHVQRLGACAGRVQRL